MKAKLIYATAPDRETAVKIAAGLVRQRLAACANMLDGMESVYRWQGQVEQARETVMLVKTTEESCRRALDYIIAEHPYECPCAVVLPIEGGHEDFLKWIEDETGGPQGH